nr:hypothetical protein [Olsenella massiliensis]
MDDAQNLMTPRQNERYRTPIGGDHLDASDVPAVDVSAYLLNAWPGNRDEPSPRRRDEVYAPVAQHDRSRLGGKATQEAVCLDTQLYLAVGQHWFLTRRIFAFGASAHVASAHGIRAHRVCARTTLAYVTLPVGIRSRMKNTSDGLFDNAKRVKHVSHETLPLAS